MDNIGWGFSLPPLEDGNDNLENNSDYRKNDKTPEMAFNPETGCFVYADERMRKLREVREKLNRTNTDPLETKQSEISHGLEEIGFSKEDMGKTGDSSTGKATEKHKAIADSQIEDAKAVMLRIRQSQGR